MNTNSTSSKRPSRARFILPIGGVGLFIACIFALVSGTKKSFGEAEVIRSIHSIALYRSEKPGVANGGPLGPWWISATSVDPVSGKLHDFSISTGTMIIAARTAMIDLDSEADTFAFDLEDVVMTLIPNSREPDTEEILVTREHYRLGPAPFGANIVPDGGAAPRPNPNRAPPERSPLAGVQDDLGK